MAGKKGWLAGLSLVLAFSACSMLLKAQSVPMRINFQGRLTDSNNQPMTSATTIILSLYRGGSAQDAPGVLLYRESASIQPDPAGVFNLLFGAGQALDGTALEAADFNTPETVFLEMSIGGTPQLPRQQVASVPYAIQAATVGGLSPSDMVVLNGGQASMERVRLNNPAASDGLQVTMTGASNSSAAATLVNLSSNASSKGLSVTSAGGKGVVVSAQGNNAIQASSSGTSTDSSTIDTSNATATTGSAIRARLTAPANAGTVLVVENPSSTAAAVGISSTTSGGTALRLQTGTGTAAAISGAPVAGSSALVDIDAGGAQGAMGLSVKNSAAANTGSALKVINMSSSAAARGIHIDTASGIGIEVGSGSGSAISASSSSTSSAAAVFTQGSASNQPAILAQTTDASSGPAGHFTNASISGSASAITGELTGANNAGTAARFLNLSANTAGRALYVESGAGDGMELRSSGGNNAAELKNNSVSDVISTLVLQNIGTGDLLRAYSGGTFDQLSAGRLRFRVTSKGNVTADGTITPGGADFAETLDAKGWPEDYEPGDVLVISGSGEMEVEKSSTPYSTAVVGIYSTKPGVLGEHPMVRGSGRQLPVALLGIVPCKVSAENGPIRPGDLLVAGSLPGHAMKGSEPGRMQGAVLGKALQPLANGTGIIQVLVSLQ